MKRRSIIATSLMGLMAMLAISCQQKGAAGGNAPTAEPRAYYVLQNYHEGHGSLPKSKKNVALYLPEQHKLVMFREMISNDDNHYMSGLMVYTTEEADGMLGAELVAVGEPGKNWGDPHVLNTDIPRKSFMKQILFLAGKDSTDAAWTASYKHEILYGDTDWYFLVANEEMTEELLALLDHEEFAPLKDFVNGYRHSGNVIPSLDEQQRNAYRQQTFGPDFLMDAHGIKGVIALGADIGSVAPKVEGLYDEVVVTDEEDEVEGVSYKLLTFKMNSEEVMMAFSYDDKTVAYLMVTTPLVKTQAPKGYYGCGDRLPSRKLFATDDYGRMRFRGIIVDENADGTIHALSIGEPLM